jgi:glutamate-1-semialdehyde 2,1-aminomutase
MGVNRNIPGGVNSPIRVFGGVDLKPVFVSQGQNSRVFDIDGNSYIETM